MSGGQPMPNPAQLPTLTEVIELLPPTPVADEGMASAPRPIPPAPGTPGSAPIVTGGLASSQAPANWTPMTTVVVPTLNDVAMPTRVFDLPVLDAVVPELTDLTEPLPAHPVVVEAPSQQAEASPASASTPSSDAGPRALSQDEAPPAAPLQQAAIPSPAPVLPDLTEAQLAQRVLGVVQKQVDGMIEFRLKEALAPILARHSEALIRDLREELSRTMADVVARSVAQEIAKLRQR